MMAQAKNEGVDVAMVKVEVSGEQFELIVSAVEGSLRQAEKAREYSIGRSLVKSIERVEKLTELLEQLRSLKNQ